MEAVGAAAEERAGVGLKAELRTEAMAEGDQVVVGLSGKEALSRTRMSVAERMPRVRALLVSSCVRMWPRFSALPVGGMGG